MISVSGQGTKHSQAADEQVGVIRITATKQWGDGDDGIETGGYWIQL